MTEKTNLTKTLGGIKITDEQDYGTIATTGGVKATVSFAVDTISVNGSLKCERDATLRSGSVNGAAKVVGNLELGKTVINGGLNTAFLHVTNSAIVNGSCEVQGGIQLDPEAKLNVNGKVKTSTITGGKLLRLVGLLDIQEISEVTDLDIIGVLEGRTLSASGNITFDVRKQESSLVTIRATNVEVGYDLSDQEVEVFKRDQAGHLVVEEIHATGKVELDHCTVAKVYAKELYAGDDVSIGEFIEVDS